MRRPLHTFLIFSPRSIMSSFYPRWKKRRYGRISRESKKREGDGARRTYTHTEGEKKNIKRIPSAAPPLLLPTPTRPPPSTLQDYHAPLALQTFLAQQPLLQQSRGSPNDPWIFSRVDPSFESLLCHCRRSWRTRDAERETLRWNPRGVSNLAILSQDLTGFDRPCSLSRAFIDLILVLGWHVWVMMWFRMIILKVLLVTILTQII